MDRLKNKFVRLFTAYRTYVHDEDLTRAKTLSTEEWANILDEALRRRTSSSEEDKATKG